MEALMGALMIILCLIVFVYSMKQIYHSSDKSNNVVFRADGVGSKEAAKRASKVKNCEICEYPFLLTEKRFYLQDDETGILQILCKKCFNFRRKEIRNNYLDKKHRDLYGNNSPPQRQSIPKFVQHEVWRRDEGRCVKCGSQEKLEFDHIIPLSKGGSNTVRNVQLLCENCNRGKSNNI
jgi:5-methylcytosine-specific restriction endonuclease McrA